MDPKLPPLSPPAQLASSSGATASPLGNDLQDDEDMDSNLMQHDGGLGPCGVQDEPYTPSYVDGLLEQAFDAKAIHKKRANKCPRSVTEDVEARPAAAKE